MELIVHGYEILKNQLEGFKHKVFELASPFGVLRAYASQPLLQPTLHKSILIMPRKRAGSTTYEWKSILETVCEPGPEYKRRRTRAASNLNDKLTSKRSTTWQLIFSDQFISRGHESQTCISGRNSLKDTCTYDPNSTSSTETTAARYAARTTMGAECASSH